MFLGDTKTGHQDFVSLQLSAVVAQMRFFIPSSAKHLARLATLIQNEDVHLFSSDTKTPL